MPRLTSAVPRGVIRVAVPNTFQQTDYTGGPASLRAVCEYSGVGSRTEREIKADMACRGPGPTLAT